MRFLISTTAIYGLLTIMTACSATAPAVRDNDERPTVSSNATPRAVLYKVPEGCHGLVPVSLSADGNRVVRYPAVSDITEYSAPVDCGNGWTLDRMGVCEGTVFTTYTLDEYRRLSHTPSADELMRRIKPGSRVTEIRILDITPREAAARIAAGEQL